MAIKIIGGIAEVGDVDEFIKTMGDIARRHSVTIQALDADRTAGAEHLRFAAEKAMRSMREGRNIANDLGLEILLYASGKRQIERALQVGISPGRNNIAIIMVGDDVERAGKDIKKVVREAPVLDYDGRKKDLIVKAFGITDAEIEAVGEGKIPELVLERVALLDIRK